MGETHATGTLVGPDAGRSTAATPAVTTLSHVNAAPAETWNYLRVNDVALSVVTPRPAGDVYARLPRALGGVETGVGAEAVAWVESVAGDATYTEVTAGNGATCVTISVGSGERADAGVLVREGAEATVVILAAGDTGTPDAAEGASATLVRIIAEQGAHVDVVEIVATRDGRTHLGGIGITAAEGATVDLRQYALGRGTVALGAATSLNATSASLAHTMRYLVRGGDTLDVNHVVRMRGRNTHADVATGGVLTEGATKTMRETIDLVRGAKGAAGSEVETVLVAGEHVVNKTLPTILCDEEDVAGTHGASIGAVSGEQLAYLADRGLAPADAEALFVRALFDDALIHAPTTEARAAILTRARDVLGDEAATDIAELLALDEEV